MNATSGCHARPRELVLHIDRSCFRWQRRVREEDQGGPTLENIHTLLGQAKESLRARDANGDGVLGASELPRNLGAFESGLLYFAQACKGLKVEDFKIPDATAPHPPRFTWGGTPAKVCQSLRDAFSNPANDNHWPAWGSPEAPVRPATWWMATRPRPWWPRSARSTCHARRRC